ncbi:substrate-binding domain-containing protein [Gemmobacter serpentinus]|uniref:ABC transporter substrate-binding protein n=1 Tax=Gemmobacter serpentinus TaxID=2652247 RepID=UPI00124CB7E7|nr:ABC transporter substrate-binding protein [Gemmobacter serpentinus]
MRIALFLLALLPGPVLAEEILLTGPPIWESAPLIALAETQPVEGITFTFAPWSTPEGLRKVLASDAPVMAVMPAPMAAILDATGIKVQVISATVSAGSIAIIGRGAPMTTPKDLRGRVLALPFRGHLPDLMMQRIAPPGAEGWQPHYTGTLLAGMQLLLAGQIDAALLPEPMATLALAQDPGLQRLADICTLWQVATALADCPPAGVVVVNPGFGVRSEVLTAYHAVFADLAGDPARAAGLLAHHFPDMAQAGPGFAGIRAQDLAMPEQAQAVADFLAQIHAVEPAAIGGKLPGPGFYGQ